MPTVDRRHLLAAGAVAGGLALLPAALRAAEIDAGGLTPLPATPRIGAAERSRRLDAARELMALHGLAAIVVEPGASLVYFTGIEWPRSERLTLAIIPARGDPVVVTPFFEAPSVRQTLGIRAEVRVWQEDESPIALAATVLRGMGAATGTVGIEETVRFFASDGLAREGFRLASANPVVRGCRMHKSPAEIALHAGSDRRDDRRVPLDLSAHPRRHDPGRYRRADGPPRRSGWAACPSST